MRPLLLGLLFFASSSLFADAVLSPTSEVSEGVKKVSAGTAVDTVAAQIIALHKEARKSTLPLSSFKAIGRLEEGQEHSSLRFFREGNDFFCCEALSTQNGWTSHTLWGLYGSQGWRQDYAPEKRDARAISAEEFAFRKVHAILLSPINCDYFNGENFLYMGKQDLAGSECLVLKEKNASVPLIYFLDAKSFLIRGYKTMDNYGGRHFESLCYIKRYQKIDGVWFPMTFEYYAENKKYRSIQWEEISLNETLDLALFKPRAKELP